MRSRKSDLILEVSPYPFILVAEDISIAPRRVPVGHRYDRLIIIKKGVDRYTSDRPLFYALNY